MRALCFRWVRIDLNSEVTWDPLKASEPEAVGSELALGNCAEPAAGMGGPGRQAAVGRTGWELENLSTLLLSLSRNHTCALAVILARERQGTGEEPHTAWLLPEGNHLGGRVAIPKSLEGEMEWREQQCPQFSASLIKEAASSFAFLHLYPGVFPVVQES